MLNFLVVGLAECETLVQRRVQDFLSRVFKICRHRTRHFGLAFKQVRQFDDPGGR